MPDTRLVELLVDATNKLVRTVDQLSEEELRADSLLPGWSRAHVVAHLALNAEGLAGALVGLREHSGVPMYSSQEDRNQDIETLAAEDPTVLRERLLAGTTIVGEESAELADNLADSRIERTPAGRTFPASAVPGMRLREVEIHHADLDAGDSRTSWPIEFSVLRLKSMARRAEAS